MHYLYNFKILMIKNYKITIILLSKKKKNTNNTVKIIMIHIFFFFRLLEIVIEHNTILDN